MYTQISSNKWKSWLLLGGFGIITVLIGFIFSRALGSPAILYGAVIFSLAYTWFSYYNSDKMILAVSKAREVKKADAPELYRLVENLAITAGLPTPRIYIINDAAPNAFATGRDPQHSVIAVTSGLLDRLEKTELEGVLAHELSHVGNYDIRLMSLVTVLVSVIALLSDWFLRISFFSRDNEDSGGGQSQMIFMIIGFVMALLAPLIGVIIQLSISRKREFLADASGALLTRYPEGLAKALEKISSDTRPLEEANKATANLYIVNPLRENASGEKRSMFAGLFSTHPPIEERIKRLQTMETQV
jgi:heat shock protein HtpX